MKAKRLVALICALVGVTTGFSVSVQANALNAEESSETPIIVPYSNCISAETISAADMVTIEYSKIDMIAEDAKRIVDDGGILYISEPECSAEEIAVKLSIPKNSTTTYQSALLVAYSICKMGDNYVISNHYVVEAYENTSGEQNVFTDDLYDETPIATPHRAAEYKQSNFDDVITMLEYKKLRSNHIVFDHKNIIDAVLQTKNDIEGMEYCVDTGDMGISPYIVTDPVGSATETWHDELYVYDKNETYYGYLSCTVYAYAHGTATVNDTPHNVYDVLSKVKAYPAPGCYVNKYKTQIHCNYTDFICLETTTLPSGVSTSSSISLSGNIGTDGPSGGGSVSTSWTYNPESQIITETSTTPNVVNWTAQTVSPKIGKAYDIAPGMRVAGPTKYQRGAHSKVYCDAMILGITIAENELQVGGWF